MVATIESLQAKCPGARLTVLTQFDAIDRPEGQSFDITDLGVQEIPWMTTPAAKLRGPQLIVKALLNAILIRATYLPGLSLLLHLPIGALPAIKAMRRADVIVSKPGGFFYGYSRLPGPHHMLHFYLASLCRRPLVIYGQSIGPFSDAVNFKWVRNVLGRATAILVRDQKSKDICLGKLQLSPEKVILTADEAFRFHGAASDPPSDEDSTLRRVGLTLINWHFPGQSDPDQTRQNYLDAMRSLVCHIFDKHHAAVDLFTFLRASSVAPGDEATTREFYNDVKDLGDIRIMVPNDPRHVKSEMQKVDVFVGSRMHSNIFALGEGIPVLAIAYQHKTTSIMSMAGLSDYVLDINHLDAGELIERFDALVQNRFDLRKTVRTAVADIAERAGQNAELTRQIATGTAVTDLVQSTGDRD